MWIYLQYAATWVFFMLIIVGLCLITPKLAKKIDQWRAKKKAEIESDEIVGFKAEQPTEDSSNESQKD
ncbi:MAG: hypothetical protein J6Q76_00680 [Clostridia bacterium]|nr:hypothetical protein [Clostridia bacterium]